MRNSNIHVSKYYLIFTVLFVTCLLISNIAATKLFDIGPMTLPAGVLLFPITYIVNDLLAEVYGYKKAKLSIYLGFAMNLLMVAYFALTIWLPAPSYFELQDAYAAILGNTPRLLTASLAAYLFGTLLNAKIMVTMKARDKMNRKLFLRCAVSTLFGELADSTIFIIAAFYGSIPLNVILTMILSQAGFKTLYEIVIFPITRIIINKVKDIEGMLSKV